MPGDMIVRLAASGEEPDQVVGVVGDQVITATPADEGKVVTVAADGSLVLAAAAGGGGGAGLTLLAETALTVDTASATAFDFTGLSGAYKDLVVQCRLRSASASNDDDIRVVLNGDTGTNYNYGVVYTASGSGALAHSAIGAAYCRVGFMSSNTGTQPSWCGITIPDYADAGYWRFIRSHFAEQSTAALGGTGNGMWRNAAAAVNRVRIQAGSGSNFKAGSRVRVYGRD